MKHYSHDYTKVSQAESMLHRVSRLLANKCYDEAAENVNEARYLLQEYLSQDNMVEDNDAAVGWVKYQDAKKLEDALDYLL